MSHLQVDGAPPRQIVLREPERTTTVEVDYDRRLVRCTEVRNFVDERDDGAGDPLTLFVQQLTQELEDRSLFRQRCAFCEKTAANVAKIIMGPRTGICNECVDLCRQILSSERQSSADPGD